MGPKLSVFITGGAGFVGSHLARSLRRDLPGARIVAFDNLRRRGSELNLGAFKKLGIEFVHGDIRDMADIDAVEGAFDVMIEASAEPSVLAGLSGSPRYLLDTNLGGTINCLEFARARAGSVVFLSTSRVYSLKPLRAIRLREEAERFAIDGRQEVPGVSPRGISELFPTDLPRSLYGATKLASEMLVQEYCDGHGLRGVINRCGVICGPGQFGKVDQGVFTLWVAHHYFKRPLRYTGFGGNGKQVRDLLHPEDLYRLIRLQIDALGEGRLSGEVFNIGGGPGVSVSMRELTGLCRQVIGNAVEIESLPESSTVDIPLFICDSEKVAEHTGWRPERDARAIVTEIRDWIQQNEAELRRVFD